MENKNTLLPTTITTKVGESKDSKVSEGKSAATVLDEKIDSRSLKVITPPPAGVVTVSGGGGGKPGMKPNAPNMPLKVVTRFNGKQRHVTSIEKRRWRKRENNARVTNELRGQVLQQKGIQDAKREPSDIKIDMSVAPAPPSDPPQPVVAPIVVVPPVNQPAQGQRGAAGPAVAPLSTFEPLDHDVLPASFVVTKETGSWWDLIKNAVVSMFDGLTVGWWVKHTWTAHQVVCDTPSRSTFRRSVIRNVWNDETEVWEARTFWEDVHSPSIADNRVVLSRGFDLMRSRPQIVEYVVDTVERGLYFDKFVPKFTRQSQYKCLVSASIASEVISNDGFVLSGAEDYERFDARYAQIA